MSKVLSALVGVSMLGLVVGVTNAAEPVTLTDAEMDGVTAGAVSLEVPDPASVHNPHDLLAVGAPGSSDFHSWILSEPEGLGNFPDARNAHNHNNNR